MIGIAVFIIISSVLLVMAYDRFCDYCDHKKMQEENDSFERLMRGQLELDTERLRAYEDILREACRSQVEEEDGTSFEDD